MKLAVPFVAQTDFFNGTIKTKMNAFIAQVVERSLGKTEVSGSSPDEGSLTHSVN